jgi:hypothetical protein
VTEADLLFAVAVLDSGPYEPDERVAAARDAILARYGELRAARDFTEASRLARAEWLGRFLASREGGG